MQFLNSKLLRRTAILISAASALALGLPAAAQKNTAKLSTGQSCDYQSMTVTPDGGILINCAAVSGTPTVGVSGPATLTVGGAAGTYTITRSGATEAITVNYSVSGSGCVAVPVAAVNIGASANTGSFTVSAATTAGSCIVAITPPAGYGTNPATVAVNVSSGGGGNPPPVSGCPTPAAGHKPMTMGWSSSPLELRMDSGEIASFPIPAPNTGKVSVKLTQGQQQMSPGDGTTEMSISKCPGVIDTSNASCYSTAANGNNFTVSKDAYTKTVYGFNSQSTLSWRGCWSPTSEGQWYVNVRWTYANSCFGFACGYSMQWATGAY